MSRNVARLFVLFVSLGMSCSSPSTKDHNALVDSGSPAVGDKWIKLNQYPGFSEEESHEVTAVEVKDGAQFVTTVVTSNKSKGPGKEVRTKHCDTGEYLLQEGETRYDPPILVMSKPTKEVKEGESWQFEKPGIVRWTFTAGKEEEVEVPAGKFKARGIEGKGETEGKPVKCTQWIAPGFPTIKSVIQMQDGEVVEVLKSFTPGKK